MDSKSDVFRRISALMIGAAAGVAMAAVILVLFQKTGFRTDSASFYLIALTAAALPLCLDVLKTRGIERELAELVMILISVLICFGYARTAAANELTAERMTRTVLLAHVPAVLVYAAQWAAFLIRRGKQNS